MPRIIQIQQLWTRVIKLLKSKIYSLYRYYYTKYRFEEYNFLPTNIKYQLLYIYIIYEYDDAVKACPKRITICNRNVQFKFACFHLQLPLFSKGVYHVYYKPRPLHYTPRKLPVDICSSSTKIIDKRPSSPYMQIARLLCATLRDYRHCNNIQIYYIILHIIHNIVIINDTIGLCLCANNYVLVIRPLNVLIYEIYLRFCLFFFLQGQVCDGQTVSGQKNQ